MQADTVDPAAAPVPRGHPRGLYVLFFSEAWERFSFYGMKGLLVDPLDLASINAWNDYERVERLNLVRRLHQLAPDAVISEISKNAFGTEKHEQ